MSKNLNEEEMKALFTNILNKDEKIVKVIKPNKLKLFIYWFTYSFWVCFWLAFCSVLPMLTSGIEGGEVITWEYYMIPVGVIVLIFIFTAIFAEVYYRNNFFAYTNSRILIRSGIIGIDFKSLDMRYVGALNVKVGFWDKVLKRETGTITFGSMSSPMASSKQIGYNFSHVEKPYELYKEMKEFVDDVKEKYKIAI